MENRPSWDETWMHMAKLISKRSYDPRLQVGAVVVSVNNDIVLSVGYNGNYSGGPHLHDSPNPGESGFIHAEMNALIKMNYNFHNEKVLYVTHSPCMLCAKLIINSKISRVVYGEEYRDLRGVELIKSCGIEVLHYI